MRHVEIMDALRRSLRQGQWRYLASFDISRAFANVSHRRPMMALKAIGGEGTLRDIDR